VTLKEPAFNVVETKISILIGRQSVTSRIRHWFRFVQIDFFFFFLLQFEMRSIYIGAYIVYINNPTCTPESSLPGTEKVVEYDNSIHIYIQCEEETS
jgi:hypothetical protein